MKFHDELNPLLWENEELIPEVKEKLKEIAEAFIEFLEIPTDAVLDKVITGSSASYNYNEFSDLDLHIIVDYDKVHEDCPLVNGYLNSLKKQFNDNHDITIHGVPVELYAEQKDQGTVHNGLYSLQTGWIDKPQKIEPTDNDTAVEAKFNEIKELVDKCDDSEEATELLEKIYTMRKAGLATAGEFCTENLAFKKLRNEGCMDKLRQIKKEQIDKQLSLESYNESIKESYTIQNVESLEKAEEIVKEKLNPKNIRIAKTFGLFYDGNKNIAQYGKGSKQLVILDSKNESIKEELTDDQLLSGAKFMMQGYGVKSIEPGQYIITIFDSQEEDAPVDGKENFVYPTLDKALQAYNKFIKKYAKVILKKYLGNGYKIIKQQDTLTAFERTYKYNSPEAFKKSIEQFRKDSNYEVEDVIEGKDLLHVVYRLVNGNKEHYCTFNNTTLERYYDINESIKESGNNYIYGKDLQRGHVYILSKDMNHIGLSAQDFTKKEIEKIKPFVDIKYDGRILEVTRDTKLIYRGKFRDSANPRGYRNIKLEIKGTGVILELSENDTFEEVLNESIKEGFNKGDKVQLKRKNNKIGIVKSIFNGDKDKNDKDIKYLDVEFEDGTKEGRPASDFKKVNESVNDDAIINPTDMYIVQVFDTRDGKWFEYYRSNDNQDAYEAYKDLKEMIKEGFMKYRFFKYPLLSAPGSMMHNTLDESLNEEDDKFNYMMLDRLRTDCEYFLGNGNGSEKNLWAGNVEDQIAEMRKIYDKLPEKPEWLSLEDIDRYEKDMLALKENLNEDRLFKKVLTALPNKQPKLNVGDKVDINGENGEIIEVKPMKMSDTCTYKIKLNNGKTIWRYEEEIMNESINENSIVDRFKEVVNKIASDFKSEGYPKSNKYLLDFVDKETAKFSSENKDYLLRVSIDNGEAVITLCDMNAEEDDGAFYQARINPYGKCKVRFSDLEGSNYMFESLHKTMSKALDEAESIYNPGLILQAYKKEQEWLNSLNLDDELAPEIMLFIIEDKEIKDTKLVKREDVYTYQPNDNEYYLDRTRDTEDVITDYNLEPAQKLVNRWNEGKKFEDVATLSDKIDQAQSELNDIISKLETSITEALDEPIEDEYEPIRQALEQYSNLDDCFLEGYVTFDDLRNNYGLSEFTDAQIEECAKEEGYEVEEDKILDPSL